MRIGLVSTVGLSFLFVIAGCKVQEVRNKWKFGTEWQHRGNNTEQERYSVEPNFDFKWDNGWTTGVSYRRRDVDNGSGDGEDGVWIDFSYPLWKAPKKPEGSADQIKALEERIAQLEGQLGEFAKSRVAGQADGPDHKGTH